MSRSSSGCASATRHDQIIVIGVVVAYAVVAEKTSSIIKGRTQMNFPGMLAGFVASLIFYLGGVGSVWGGVVTEWVTVGNPGNPGHMVMQADGTSGYGSVAYEYQIGKYEVTNDHYTEFLNAVAATDTNDLYLDLMGQEAWGGISRFGASGSYTYAVRPNMGNKPVNYVTWQDGARYTNWLHNGQPVGAQDATTTEDGAYTFIDIDTAGPRNPGAQVFMPNEHEWHKAAFHQSGVVTRDGDEWWFYPIGSDILPRQAVADAVGDVRNPGPTTLNFFHSAGWNGQISGNVVTVGSSGGRSYYGAFDMGGNVFEWTTADPTKPDPSNVGPYIVRGASFHNTSGHLRNNERNLGPKPGGGGHQHSFPSRNNGFRVASYVPTSSIVVPEPTALALIVAGLFGFASVRRSATRRAVLVVALLLSTYADRAAADMFGNGGNIFDIEFVDIGNAGNAPDASNAANPDLPGAVAYNYRIAKYEVSEDMIGKANYAGGLGIATSSRGANKPATSITWIEAIKFANWLNTSNGKPAAYKMLTGNTFTLWQPGDAGYDASNPYRNTQAKYFLPSSHEWYKAAFYDPLTGNYFDYATGSNTVPEPVEFGTDPNTAIYGQVFQTTDPADITQAGALSAYGTMAQSGNVFELEETDFDMVNDTGYSPRGARGGVWYWTKNAPGFLSRTFRNSVNPDGQVNFLGFRVASRELTADFDFDGDVDGNDLAEWNTAFGITSSADSDGDSDSDGGDFFAWQRSFYDVAPLAAQLTPVPEPASIVLAAVVFFLVVNFRQRCP
ncbi:MAG: SUMF1/EgtB/PvdO family nonheme iron enzyme [Pirellulales bacterium]|nr:SUMF1/EgtB/PvdO family nonheme iron enzyme [Pirellulales bacterium]